MKRIRPLWVLAGLAWLAGPLATLAARPPAPDRFLAWPEVSRETRPWTRWWWLGSTGTPADYSEALDTYARAGLGGVEITPIYGVRGEERRFRPFLRREFNGLLEHVLAHAEKADLGVDMATGTGWPFGGPWVTPDDACKLVVRRRFTLKGGERLGEAVEHVQRPLLRQLGRRVSITDLRDPVAANEELQALALEQVQFPRRLPLIALRAVSAGGATVDLTARVDARCRLHWTAPAGDWTLYALFQGYHGKLVERAGPGGEGDVIDHFSAPALDRYLRRFDQALRGRRMGTLRAFFNDSYEVDDASGEANWTPDLLAEFRRRRGYDLLDHLPAFFGQDTAGANARVLTDYRETLSDLILERFTTRWQAWAAGRGALVRNQAHGSPANVLDLYAAVDIPETEGEDVYRIQSAASAAHVTGKRLISAEAATWLDEHFLETLGGVKQAVDRFFLGGVNHIVYHGTPFSPRDAAWPGVMFYASTHLGPTNTLWRDFPALNAYVTRAQSFLQKGEPDNDVLLYWPFHDRLAEAGRRSLTHFAGAEGPTIRAAAENMAARGTAYSYCSDLQVAGLAVESGKVRTAAGTLYQAIVVPETELMPAETAEKLAALAESGATIVFHRRLPRDVPGLARLEERRSRFQAAMARLGGAQSGTGRVFTGVDLSRLLDRAEVRKEPAAGRGLQFLRRKWNGDTVYFFANRGEQRYDAVTRLSVAGVDAALFDPMRGTSGRVRLTPAQRGSGSDIRLSLAPGESAILVVSNRERTGPQTPVREAAQPSAPLAGTWTLRFLAGGPVLPPPATLDRLGSWTEGGTPDHLRFSGTVRYSLTFPRPAGTADEWLLNLGGVAESASVRLNGRSLGTLLGPAYEVPFPAGLLSAENRLEVEVTNLMANRIADMDRRQVPYRRFYNINFPARRRQDAGPDGLFTAAGWQPRPSGLLGPVTLTPLRWAADGRRAAR